MELFLVSDSVSFLACFENIVRIPYRRSNETAVEAVLSSLEFLAGLGLRPCGLAGEWSRV
jgi:hypothetical protein